MTTATNPPGWRVDLRGHIGDLAVDARFESTAGPTIVIGPNGAGKTTLLRAIAGAAVGLRGCVELRGRALMDSSRRIDVAPERRRIGYLPQGFGLFPHLSAVDNVAFGCGRGETARDRARAALESVDALYLADRGVEALSGGERQRVALARALAIDPVGLLLDEPLAALDVGRRKGMRAFLAQSLEKAKLPAIVVTHDPRDVLALGGHVVAIESGHVAQAGTAAELARAPGTDFVAEFFDGSPAVSAPRGP